MSTGYIFCLSNESMPGILKVDMTEKSIQEMFDDMIIQIEDSDNHLVPPTSYEIEFAMKVNNPSDKLITLHNILEKYTDRINYTYFFRASNEDVKEFFELMDGEFEDYKEDKDGNVIEHESLIVKFTDLSKVRHDLTSQLNIVKSELKSKINDFEHDMQIPNSLNKVIKKRNREPSGFIKPTKISYELATFLGKEPGTLMARTDVTKQITAYIRSNSLQDKANGRLILADEKLKKLLKYDEKTITEPKNYLSYFNLERYLSGHFEK